MKFKLQKSNEIARKNLIEIKERKQVRTNRNVNPLIIKIERFI